MAKEATFWNRFAFGPLYEAFTSYISGGVLNIAEALQWVMEEDGMAAQK